MTDQNTNTLNEYILWLKSYFIIIGVLVYVIAVSYTKNEKIRNILINLGCILPAGFLLGSSIYGTMLAVKFLDNKKYKRALYK
jgi:hypothetical protein